MSKELWNDQGVEDQESSFQKKYLRHQITMENSREETVKRMRSFPERADRLREMIRALREADAR